MRVKRCAIMQALWQDTAAFPGDPLSSPLNGKISGRNFKNRCFSTWTGILGKVLQKKLVTLPIPFRLLPLNVWSTKGVFILLCIPGCTLKYDRRPEQSSNVDMEILHFGSTTWIVRGFRHNAPWTWWRKKIFPCV